MAQDENQNHETRVMLSKDTTRNISLLCHAQFLNNKTEEHLQHNEEKKRKEGNALFSSDPQQSFLISLPIPDLDVMNQY